MSTTTAQSASDKTEGSAPAKPAFVKGLAGVVAVQTAISSVDGPTSTLLYRGVSIHELAERALYEEVAYMLLYGRLPNAAELADFNFRLVANRWLPFRTIDESNFDKIKFTFIFNNRQRCTNRKQL